MIDDDNFFQYALKNYNNPQCKTIDEFNEDLCKFKHIKKIIHRDEINTKLLLNHIIVILNVFEVDAGVKMLFYKINKDRWCVLKTILTYLNYMPASIQELGVIDSNIAISQEILDELKDL